MRSKLIERIRKLLAVGNKEKNPYEEEVNTALALAKKLMAEHNLTLSEVEVKQSGDDDIDKVFSKEYGKIRFWQKTLALVVAKIFQVKSIQYPLYKRGIMILFVGYKEDSKIAKEVYEYLVDYIKLLGKKAESDRKRRTSYYEGLMERLWERANEEVLLDRMNTVKCRTIVVAKEHRIKDWLTENMKLKPANNKYISRKDFYRDSYEKGRKDANNIDLRNRNKINRS